MDEITRLRELLGLENDREVTETVQQRVSSPQQRTEDVAEILPQALDVARRDGRLAAALKQPIEDTLQQSIEDNPREIAEVLYPVMGPAIRRSITETLSAALEGLNQGLQHGFSARGMKWRLESWRTGVPFREVVLRHTLKYQVSEAYLVHKDTGLLIARAGIVEEGSMDRDAVAAMLTAIEDFVADSTGSEGDEGELSSAALAGRTMWILQGYAARLALVVQGQPPLSLRLELQDRLAGMHERFGGFMHGFDGAEDAPPGLVDELEQCLGFESADDDEQKGSPKAAIAVLGLLALVLLGWAVWAAWDRSQTEKQWRALKSAVAQLPGVVWLGEDREDGRVRLLVDPLVEDLESLPENAGFDSGEILIETHPYLSAQPVIVLKRLQTALGSLPVGVTTDVTGEALVLGGEAPAGWTRDLARVLGTQAFLVDSSGLSTPSLADELRRELQPPGSALIEDAGEKAVRISGLASTPWRNQAGSVLSAKFLDVSVDWSGLRTAEREQLSALSSELTGHQILFESDTVPADPAQVESLAPRLQLAADLIADCPCQVRFRVTGCSDQTGSTRTNQRVRDARARFLFQLLRDNGIPADLIATESTCPDLLARAAVLEMRLEEQ